MSNEFTGTYEVREAAAQYQQGQGADPLDGNGDEQSYGAYEGSFTKLLEHDGDGVLTADGVQEYEKLVAALEGCDVDAIAAVKLKQPVPPQGSARRVLINPQSAYSHELSGAAVGHVGMPAPPRLNSRRAAAEMVEVYGAALLRDTSFSDYGGSSDAATVVTAMTNFGADYTGPRNNAGNVIARLLYRGLTRGDRRGPFISQFLLLPFFPLFPSGCAPFVGQLTGVANLDLAALRREQTYPTPSTREFLTTEATYSAVQNGQLPETYVATDYDYTLRYIDNGRALGGLVHVDSPYEAYYNALNILIFRGAPNSRAFPYNQSFPGSWIPNQADGHTMGPPDAYALIAKGCIAAFKAAWAQKWRAFRRLRPEVMGARVHHTFKNVDLSNNTAVNNWLSNASDPTVNPYALHPDLLRYGRDVLKLIKAKNGGTLLLGQMYPEGSPSHPAYPSGHATVAGACTTILKAMFDDEAELPALPPHASDPTATLGYVRVNNAGNLVDFTGSAQLTIGGELDKLASNIAHGRDFGGVHYRSDGDEGIALGERVAIRLLQDHARTYPETGFLGFEFTRRDGVRIRVSAEDVVEL